MSHIAKYESSLCHVNRELFMEAMRMTAKERGVELTETVDSYDEGRNVRQWHGLDVIASIRTPQNGFPQGLGVHLAATGGKTKPVFVCDKLWNAETTCGLDQRDPRFKPLAEASIREMESLKRDIERKYKILALALVMKKRGFRVTSGKVGADVPFVMGERSGQ